MFLPPTKAMQEIELSWAADEFDEEERDLPSRVKIIEHVVKGLESEAYDARAWLRAAAVGSPRGRARDIVTKWGSENFEVRRLTRG